MVAQVGPRVGATERLHRQHQVPVRTHVGQPLQRSLVERLAAVGPVVEQHAHFHAPRRSLLHRGEEAVGRGIRLQDVELDVDVLGRFTDGGCHGVDRVLIARDERRTVVARDRHGAEIAVEAHRCAEPLGRVRPQRPEIESVAHRADGFVDDLLLAPALAWQARRADQQEQKHPDDRDEVDGEQPGHRRRRPAVPRHEDDRENTHGHIGHEDHECPDERPPRLFHARSPAVRFGSA